MCCDSVVHRHTEVTGFLRYSRDPLHSGTLSNHSKYAHAHTRTCACTHTYTLLFFFFFITEIAFTGLREKWRNEGKGKKKLFLFVSALHMMCLDLPYQSSSSASHLLAGSRFRWGEWWTVLFSSIVLLVQFYCSIADDYASWAMASSQVQSYHLIWSPSSDIC